jgi:hypothetical protein
MNLKESIRRILREESTKDLSPIIQKLIDMRIVRYYGDILCKVEVSYYDDLYNVDFYFLGGPSTEYWPITRDIQEKYNDIENETWDLIFDTMDISLYLHTKFVRSCN